MKGKTLGRLELLSWVNDSLETDYPKIELLSDGIAYAQFLDAVHPNVVPLWKLNFQAKHKDDCARNLKLTEDLAKKLKLPFMVDVPNLSIGKFASNKDLVQWLYDYCMKNGGVSGYDGYARRVDAYKK